jgi:hypothetical protein
MQILPDQSCEHVMVDAADNTTTRTITIEPDRHGMTINFEGCGEQLVIDFSEGVISVYARETQQC